MQMRVSWAEGWTQGPWPRGRMLDAVGRGSQHKVSRGGTLIGKEQILIPRNSIKRIIITSTTLEPKLKQKRKVKFWNLF